MENKTDLAWAAGFFDGEGCIFVSECSFGDKRKTRYQLQITVTQLVKEPLDKLASLFGGKIIITKNKFNRSYYRWDLRESSCIPVLEKLLPFLVVKHDEAKLVLDNKNYFNTKFNKWNPLDSITYKNRQEVRLKLMELKENKNGTQ